MNHSLFRNKKTALLGIAALLFLANGALAATAAPATPVSLGPAMQAGQVLDGITNTFANSVGSWMNNAQGYAKDLFLSLALIEFTWAAIQLTIKKGELQDLIASTMMKIVGIGFFYSLLMEAPAWIPAIMNSFGQAGMAVGTSNGAPPMLSPSGIFDQGLVTAGNLVSAMNNANSGNVSLTSVIGSGGGSIGSFLFGAIVTGLTGLMVILSFTVIAVQLMVTLIESYVVIGGGMLMLGFTGSRWTLPFGEKYFGYAVSTGIKLFTLYLIAGQGGTVANAITAALTANGHTPGPADFLGAGASSVAYGAMGYMVPAMAGSMMNGAPALSMGNMAAAGGGMAGSIVSAGAMAGAAALSGVGAITSAFNKTSQAASAGSIGGETMQAASGSIGGSLSGKGAPPTAAFGAGTSSPVAAPSGMTGASSTGGSSSSSNASGGASGGKTAGSPASSFDSSSKPAGNSAPAGMNAAGSNSEVSNQNLSQAQNLNSDSGISSKGGADAVSSTTAKKDGIDLSKKAESLNDMARRMDRLPQNDGHSGGISIKLNHIE